MGYQLPVTMIMIDMQCGKCGIQYSVPEEWQLEKKNTGNSWYCPNGHCRVYLESEIEKALKELNAEKQRHSNTLSRLNEAEASERKAQNKIKRIKKRAANERLNSLSDT